MCKGANTQVANAFEGPLGFSSPPIAHPLTSASILTPLIPSPHLLSSTLPPLSLLSTISHLRTPISSLFTLLQLTSTQNHLTPLPPPQFPTPPIRLLTYSPWPPSSAKPPVPLRPTPPTPKPNPHPLPRPKNPNSRRNPKPTPAGSRRAARAWPPPSWRAAWRPRWRMRMLWLLRWVVFVHWAGVG